jgi:hypothetical protein
VILASGQSTSRAARGVDIDEDVRVEYWTQIRHQPENVDKTSA